MFIAVHKWKPEEEIAVMKETVASYTAMVDGKVPEGVELCSLYSGYPAQRAFCVWKACCKEDLEKLFEQCAPTMKKGTEFVTVTQMYPPTPEFVISLYQAIIKMASK